MITSKLKLLSIAAVTLLAASCNTPKPNDLDRPGPTENQNTNQTNTTDDTSFIDDHGEVAGTQIVQLPTKTIKVNDRSVDVEVADTDDSRKLGLSGRDKLDEGKGLLFDFTNTDFKRPGFWMKDMNFSIDIIWIKDGKVIDIKNDAPLPPDDNLPVYYPPSEVSHVLEVPAGWSAKNNITAGSTVSL